MAAGGTGQLGEGASALPGALRSLGNAPRRVWGQSKNATCSPMVHAERHVAAHAGRGSSGQVSGPRRRQPGTDLSKRAGACVACVFCGSKLFPNQQLKKILKTQTPRYRFNPVRLDGAALPFRGTPWLSSPRGRCRWRRQRPRRCCTSYDTHGSLLGTERSGPKRRARHGGENVTQLCRRWPAGAPGRGGTV